MTSLPLTDAEQAAAEALARQRELHGAITGDGPEEFAEPARLVAAAVQAFTYNDLASDFERTPNLKVRMGDVAEMLRELASESLSRPTSEETPNA